MYRMDGMITFIIIIREGSGALDKTLTYSYNEIEGIRSSRKRLILIQRRSNL